MRWYPVSPPSRAESAKVAARLGPAMVVAVATACSSPAPITYDLSAPSARIRGVTGVQVLVGEPTAVQALSGQQIIVRDASGAISFIGNGQWADTLPRLVQAKLIYTFENSSQIRGVARPSSGAVADVQLVSEIRSFEVATPANQAVVQISVKIVSDQTGRILNGRIFTSRAPVASVDAANAVQALNEALSAAMLDIVRWVSASPLPVRDEPGRGNPA